jgi:poly(A) polymerase
MNATPNPSINLHDVNSSHSQAKLLREYAIEVVRVLTSRNYIAYFAGGCVRDEIMGGTPSDYDVATNATPEQVQQIFGKQRSLMIGEAFGVVCVHQRRSGQSLQVEVATFRSDGSYIDGRRPDSVDFTSPELDAQRRDFTINGVFYDPIAEKTIDFVQGQKDIASRIIRAIGDPFHRFAEDRLRLLRAVRFTSRFGFSLDQATWQAICAMADRIVEVSPERIATEMRKMLSFRSGRRQAIELLHQSGLLRAILLEAETVLDRSDAIRLRSLSRIERLPTNNWIVALVALLWDDLQSNQIEAASFYNTIKDRWRLSNEEELEFRFVVTAQQWLLRADNAPWSQLQPLLLSPHIESAICLTDLLLNESASDVSAVKLALDHLRKTLSQDIAIWNPMPLIDGQLLIELKVPIGPEYAKLIKLGRAAQLDGLIHNDEDARQWLCEVLTSKMPVVPNESGTD